LVAHVPNYYSSANRIVNEKMIKGTLPYPKEDFYRLLDMKDDQKVFVIDYEALKRAPLTAANHPLLNAFVGEETSNYIMQHKKLFCQSITMHFNWGFIDWFCDEPYARPLYVRSKECKAVLECGGTFTWQGSIIGIPSK
jgi:hypothetical protein